ncbi:hypothetical protein FJ365_06130 [Candidatus Dependentiae bacterium]|nr:hypothetical protein [Candidatus Dependentiae bacterium]
MSFWLHQHPVVRALSSLPAAYWYAVAGIASLLCVLAISIRMIFPIQRSLQQVEQQLKDLETQVVAFEEVLEQQPAISAEHNRLVAQKKTFAADIAVLQDTLNDLLLIMRDHKVSCRGIVPLGGKQEGLHEKHLVSLKAKGSFCKLISLLQELEQPQYPLTMRAVNLVKTRGTMVHLDAIVQVISLKES